MSLWPFGGRRRREQELEDEIRWHLSMAAQDRIDRGEDPSAAAVASRREFGNRTLVAETTRGMWGWTWLEALRQDVGYALRGMRRSPAFTTVAVLSLALGIGANTAIFSVIDTLMLRPLPVDRPEQLVEPLHRFQDEPHFNNFSWRNYRYFLARSNSFSGLMAMASANFNYGPFFNVVTQGRAAERVDGVYVTGNFFPLLGVKPALGRLIGPEDDHLDAPANVAVVSWNCWRNRFGSDASILGRQILVEGKPVTIVGVAPRGFEGLSIEKAQDLWVPLAMQPVIDPQNSVLNSRVMDLMLVGRLKSGITLRQARAEMAVLSGRR